MRPMRCELTFCRCCDSQVPPKRIYLSLTMVVLQGRCTKCGMTSKRHLIFSVHTLRALIRRIREYYPFVLIFWDYS